MANDLNGDFSRLHINEGPRFEFTPALHLPTWPTAESQNVKLRRGILHSNKNKHQSRLPLKRAMISPSRSRSQQSADDGALAQVLDFKLTLEPSSPGVLRPQTLRPEGPLTLFSLPRELRDHIYDLAIDRDKKSRTAKLRTVFRPMGHRRGFQKVTRRFPLEPRLAFVSRQLRDEVLSKHYGAFALVFDNDIQHMLQAFDRIVYALPTHLVSIASTPVYLEHIKLSFKGSPLPVELELKVLPCGKIQLRLGALAHCACLDKLAVNPILDGWTVECGTLSRGVDPDGFLQLKVRRARDLTDIASSILLDRRNVYLTSINAGLMTLRGNRVHIAREDCNVCAWPKLRWTEL